MTYTLEDEVRDLESKYSDEEIRKIIDLGRDVLNDVEFPEQHLLLCLIAGSQVVESMIAYNNMIDARIERAVSHVEYSQKES